MLFTANLFLVENDPLEWLENLHTYIHTLFIPEADYKYK